MSEATERLITELWNKDEQIRNHAVESLVQLGESALPEILTAIKKDDHSSEARGFENKYLRSAFVQIGEPAFRAIIAALQPDRGMVRAAAKTIVLFQDVRAVEPLIASFLDERTDINGKCYVIEALSKFKEPRAFEHLVAALEDENGYIRSNAAVALSEYCDPRVIPLIFAALLRLPKIDQEMYEYDICGALASLGEPAYEFATIALHNSDSRTRFAAQRVLDRIKRDKKIHEKVQEILGKKSTTG